MRIIRKVPELMEIFVPSTRAMLTERNHGMYSTDFRAMKFYHFDLVVYRSVLLPIACITSYSLCSCSTTLSS